MADEERWTVTRAMNNFYELLEHVITSRQPIFIDGKRKGAVLICMEEWDLLQEKLRPRSLSSPR